MTNIQGLKIGLDYHGVIDCCPTYFSQFCSAAINRGHQIFIITGGPAVKIKQILDNIPIAYNHIFAITDYYQALGMVEQTADGSFAIPDKLWNQAKGEFCFRNHIDFHIDDSLAYRPWFQTPFCWFDNQTFSCSLLPKHQFCLKNIDNFLNSIEQYCYSHKD